MNPFRQGVCANAKRNFQRALLVSAIFSTPLAMAEGAGSPNGDQTPPNKTTPRATQADFLLDVAQKAVLNNPEVLSRWHNYLAASEETSSVRAGYFPRLDLAASAGKESGITHLNSYSRYDTRSVSLTLTQMLYDGLATRNEVLRLNNAQLARYYEFLDSSETAALDATRAFYDVARQRKLLELTEENYIRHRIAVEQIRLKVAAGVGRQVDLEQASARLSLSESNLIIDNANLHDAGARFQRVVGELPPEKLPVSPSQTRIENQVQSNSVADTLAVAINFHPAILAAVESVRSANFDVYGRKSKYQPTVNLTVARIQGENQGGLLGATSSTAAAVNLNWNLFNGGSDMARVNQFAQKLQAAEDVRDKSCRDVRMNLEIAHNDVRKLAEQLIYLDRHQLALEKALMAYQKQFEVGQRTLLDVLDTENELYQAKRSYTNAQFDLAVARARTLAGMGKLISGLGIARLETSNLPELAGTGAEAAHNCAAEGPKNIEVDKKELDARALALARASVEPPQPDAADEARLKADQEAQLAAEKALAEAQAEEAAKAAAAKREAEKKAQAEALALKEAQAARIKAENLARAKAARLAAAKKAAANPPVKKEGSAVGVKPTVSADAAARLAAQRKAHAVRMAKARAAKLKAEKEAARLAAEKEAQEEAARVEAEKAAQAEAARVEAEKAAQAEAARLEAEKEAQTQAVAPEAETAVPEEAVVQEAGKEVEVKNVEIKAKP